MKNDIDFPLVNHRLLHHVKPGANSLVSHHSVEQQIILETKSLGTAVISISQDGDPCDKCDDENVTKARMSENI